MRVRKKKCVALVGILLVGILAGCGEREKVDKGMQLIETLDYAGALAQFAEARAEGENERLITRGEGIAYLGLTEYEQAIECFQASLLGSDGWVQDIDYDVNYYLAAAYTKNEQYEEAKAVYDAILDLKPGEEDAYLLRGNVLLALSRYDEAKEDFDRVIAMDSKNYDRLIEIYQVLENYGYKDAGLEYLDRAVASSDNSKMDNYDKGRIYYYMGDYQKAFECLLDNHSLEAEICLSFLLKYIVYSVYAAKEVGYDINAADDVMAAGFNWCPPLALYQALADITDVKELIRNRLPDIYAEADAENLLSDIKPSKYDYRKFFKSGRKA